MKIRQLKDSDFNQVIDLLSTNRLLTIDLKTIDLNSFVVVVERNQVVGVGGLQIFNKIALLRSLAVNTSKQSMGIGKRILHYLEEIARARGIIRLYLLTTSADMYFLRQGYDRIERDVAPIPIKNTDQFSQLCPASAIPMQKSLGKTNGRREFDGGLYCAESALTTIAEHYKIESDFIPAIASGLCGGMSRTNGTCGALSGSVLGISLMLGRSTRDDSSDSNYAAVQALVDDFSMLFGSSKCSELLGCDLGTQDGQELFEKQGLHRRCREFTGIAADLAVLEIESAEKK